MNIFDYWFDYIQRNGKFEIWYEDCPDCETDKVNCWSLKIDDKEYMAVVCRKENENGEVIGTPVFFINIDLEIRYCKDDFDPRSSYSRNLTKPIIH